jgi:hypothetical protein
VSSKSRLNCSATKADGNDSYVRVIFKAGDLDGFFWMIST